MATKFAQTTPLTITGGFIARFLLQYPDTALADFSKCCPSLPAGEAKRIVDGILAGELWLNGDSVQGITVTYLPKHQIA